MLNDLFYAFTDGDVLSRRRWLHLLSVCGMSVTCTGMSVIAADERITSRIASVQMILLLIRGIP